MKPPFDIDFHTNMDEIMEEICSIDALINLDFSIPSDNHNNEPVFVQTYLKNNKNIPLF